MSGRRTFVTWLGFAAVNTVAALALAVAGQLAQGRTSWIAGDGSVLAGCLASLAGSLIGAFPLSRVLAERASTGHVGVPVPAIGKASLFRLLVTLLAGGGAILFGDWQRRSLLFALAVSYVLLLAVETAWLMSRLRVSKA